jgi:hypothetical protein
MLQNGEKRKMKYKIFLTIIVMISLISLISINLVSSNLSLFPRAIDEPLTYIPYTVNITNSSGSVLLSQSQIVFIDKTGIGFISVNLTTLNNSVPSKILVYKSGILVYNDFFSDLIFNSIRVNELYANNINATNITSTYFIGSGKYLTGITATSNSSFNETYANLLNQNCPTGKVVNGTNSSGGFICVTPTAIETDPAWTGNLTSGLSQDLNVNSKKLTNVGELIMNGLIRSQNMTPVTDNLYSLGNSTNWFKEIFVKTIYANDINTTNLVASDINTNNIDSITSNTTNLTIGGFDVYKDAGGNLNINLD